VTHETVTRLQDRRFVLRLTDEAGPKKNKQSIRDVPIHPVMLAEITERAEVLGEGWLFPTSGSPTRP
jgi:hypothetical protein